MYVGIAGQGITTARNTVLRQLESQTSITHEIVDSLLDNNLNTHPGEREVLDVIPQEYKVGTQLQVDPIGVLTDSIEGRFLNITASPSLRENIDKCFAQAGIEIATNYTAPSDGWIFASGTIGDVNYTYTIMMNGGPIPVRLVGYSGDWAGTTFQVTIPVKAGDILAFPSISGAYLTFYPCREA